MTRLVIDTNVFISAALKQRSWPAQNLQWVVRHGGLLKSTVTEQEVREVIARPRLAPKISPRFIDQLDRLFKAAEMVAIATAWTGCRDAKDDKFLELAVNGRADLIISGDVDLLVLGSFQGIPIITPAMFGRDHPMPAEAVPGKPPGT